MHLDNNFVVYGPNGATWSTRTNSANGNSTLRMQPDGNLVVYAAGGPAVFNTGTNPSGGDRVVMQTYGNLVVYSGGGPALWSANGGKIGSPAASSGGSLVDDYPPQWRNVAQYSVMYNYYECNQECTSFAAWRLSSRGYYTMPFSDNANAWGADARNRGTTLVNTPTPG